MRLAGQWFAAMDSACARVTRAFLKMMKFDIAALERAYVGKG